MLFFIFPIVLLFLFLILVYVVVLKFCLIQFVQLVLNNPCCKFYRILCVVLFLLYFSLIDVFNRFNLFGLSHLKFLNSF